MSDLTAFRRAVHDARRLTGHTQQQLARAIGLHPNVLSHKLHGHGESVLTTRDALAIVVTVVAWGAFTRRSEVDALLGLMSVPRHLAADQLWYTQLTESRPERPPAGASAWRLDDLPRPLQPLPLPQPVTPFIGRAAEVAAVLAAVRRSRLVTLTGAGGTGKTRVALAAAGELTSTFSDGVAFADLTPLTDPALVAVALLRAAGLPPRSAGEAETQLAEALQTANLLLVVDNVEHVVDGAATLSRLLNAAPGVHVLVTSRLLLRLYGEQHLRIPPMKLPADTAATAEGIRDSEAVQLFLQRANAVHAGLDPHGEALEAVAAICSNLDGLPLAIELAAAQSRIWSPQAILVRLSDRLDFLSADARDVPERHRSLRATLQWSDALLTDAERHVFLRVGVFVGTFDAFAAAEVVESDPEDALRLLSALATHSLLDVARTDSSGMEPHFRMLESVREYALARLDAEGSLDEARLAHLRHCLRVATEIDADHLAAYERREPNRLQAQVANINAALDWASVRAEQDPVCLTEGLRLATLAARIWLRHSSMPEGSIYLLRLLDIDAQVRTAPDELRESALFRAGMVTCNAGDLERTRTLATEFLGLARRCDDFSGMSWAHRLLGEAALADDDLPEAELHFDAQLGYARRSSDRGAESDAHNMLGQLRARQGRYTEGEDQLNRSVAVSRAAGKPEVESVATASLAELALRRWDVTLAAERWAAALRLHWDSGNRRAIAYALEGGAMTIAVNDEPDAALRWVAAAQRLRMTGGWVLPAPEKAFLEEIVAGAVGSMTAGQREEAVADGRRRDLSEIVVEALSELELLAGAPATEN